MENSELINLNIGDLKETEHFIKLKDKIEKEVKIAETFITMYHENKEEYINNYEEHEETIDQKIKELEELKKIQKEIENDKSKIKRTIKEKTEIVFNNLNSNLKKIGYGKVQCLIEEAKNIKKDIDEKRKDNRWKQLEEHFYKYLETLDFHEQLKSKISFKIYKENNRNLISGAKTQKITEKILQKINNDLSNIKDMSELILDPNNNLIKEYKKELLQNLIEELNPMASQLKMNSMFKKQDEIIKKNMLLKQQEEQKKIEIEEKKRIEEIRKKNIEKEITKKTQEKILSNKTPQLCYVSNKFTTINNTIKKNSINLKNNINKVKLIKSILQNSTKIKEIKNDDDIIELLTQICLK